MQSHNYQVSEVQLVYRTKTKPSERPTISSSSDAYKIFQAGWEKDRLELQEEFKAIFLNRGNRVLGMYHLSTGGITGTVADPRLLFTAALKLNCSSIIICHNHPSGSLRPSSADEELTCKIKNAGSFLDIKVLDHLIISTEGYYSFADEGIL